MQVRGTFFNAADKLQNDKLKALKRLNYTLLGSKRLDEGGKFIIRVQLKFEPKLRFAGRSSTLSATRFLYYHDFN